MKPSPHAAILLEHAKRHALERLRANAETSVDLLDFIPRVSRGRLEAPRHLARVLELARRIDRGEPVRAIVATPPRHGKTTLWLHALVWILKRHPEWPVAYITYAAELAQSKSYEARNIAHEAGVNVSKDRANLGEWMTQQGGRFVATGVGGALTGRGFRVVLTDDPFKGRQEADSPLIRERTYEWFNSVAFTRQEPAGTAFVVNATRWHPDDLSGRLIAQGWEYINLRAIDDDEQSLWPAKFSSAWLRAVEAQIGPYEFGALYQGEPRQKGTSVFGEPTYFDALPIGVGMRTAIGNDFAYTIRSWSDFSVAVVLRRYVDGVCYVVEVLRMRSELPAFRAELRQLANRHPGAQIVAFVSGTEKGGLQFFGEGLREQRVEVDALPAVGDKFQRAQPVAAAWNAGKIQIPRTLSALGECGAHLKADEGARPPWLPAFLDEVRGFTGVKDAHDDQIDALAGAFEPFRAMVPREGDEVRAPKVILGDRSHRWGSDGGRGFG